MNNIIAVTMGDPAGIGPEIIIKSLSEPGLLVPRWWWWAVCARCDVLWR